MRDRIKYLTWSGSPPGLSTRRFPDRGMPVTVPGWYKCPYGGKFLRYWDGESWTTYQTIEWKQVKFHLGVSVLTLGIWAVCYSYYVARRNARLRVEYIWDKQSWVISDWRLRDGEGGNPLVGW